MTFCAHHTVPFVKTLYVTLCIVAGAGASQPDRLPASINTRNTVMVHGSRSPRIARMADEGPIGEAKRIAGLSLHFKPSTAQMAALERLLQDQQDPSSRLYHAWLSPEEFGERFGISANDLGKVTGWLAAQGFRVEAVARSRTYITFSGTAAQVRDAFRTELHRYRGSARTYFANSTEATIPADLEPLVSSISGLDDFRTKAQRQPRPMYNLADGGHYIAPGDLNTIYNVRTLHQNGLTGVGQKIVIVGQSLFLGSDLDLYRSRHGLPPTTPEVIVVPGRPDPGMTGDDDFAEADVDIQFAGIAAPDATLIFVYSDDVWSAIEYAIDQNLGPIISSSYSLCERSALLSDVSALRFLGQHAGAQGITWLGISGDAGAAGCDPHNADPKAVFGVAATLPASLPEVTGIGGTEFVEGADNYWNNTNGVDGSSAISYIPETAWNDSSTSVKGLGASGGGMSAFWARPPWQTGPGVPNDNVRHVPDISFTSSWKHDAYAVIYKGDLLNAGGTSAAAPFFAGALALLNQYVVSGGFQSKPGLGNINPRLYQLAQSTNGVFHDIVTGDNVIPCKLGTNDCATGSYGYQAGPGYDHVTGLGSIDIGRLLEKWVPTPDAKPSAVVPSVEPSPVYRQPADAAGYRFSFTVRLTETGGTATTLTGLTIGGYDYSAQIAAFFGSANLSAYGTLSTALRAKEMNVPVDVVLSVSGIDATGQKWTKQLTVSFLGDQPEPAARMSLTSVPGTIVPGAQPDSDCDATYPYSQLLILQETGGAEVRLNKFIAGGYDASDQIVHWFGSRRLPPYWTVYTHVCLQRDSLPRTLDYEVAGVDETGRTVKAGLRTALNPAASNLGTLSISKSRLDFSSQLSRSATASLNIDVPSGEQWAVSVFQENQKTNWLAATPQSGTGTGQVNLTASGADLADGIYRATLIVQSENTVPQYVIIPVSFRIGGAIAIPNEAAGGMVSVPPRR